MIDMTLAYHNKICLHHVSLIHFPDSSIFGKIGIATLFCGFISTGMVISGQLHSCPVFFLLFI